MDLLVACVGWGMCLQDQCVLFPPEAQGSGETMGAMHRGRNSFALTLLPFAPPSWASAAMKKCQLESIIRKVC